MTSHRATILVTGPNRAARAFLADNLEADGHEVIGAPTVQTAWQLISSTTVDLVVVDLSDLSRFDRGGMELVTRIRDATRLAAHVDPATPIVVIAPRIGEVERLRMFEQGADDLVQHPYSYPELRARIGSLLRRTRGGWGPARLRVGTLEVDPVSRQAWLDAEPLGLAGKEFALLATLASEPTRVFSRGELLERVWGFSADSQTRTVDVHASRLRRKLMHASEEFVVNAWGEGYRLVSAKSEPAEGAAAAPGVVARWPAGATGRSALTLVEDRAAA